MTRYSVPEFLSLKRQKIITTEKPILYNGLYRKDGETKIHTLFRVDLVTGTRIEIEPREGRPKPRVNGPSPIDARSWAITRAPVPDLIATDYFCNLYPEIDIVRAKGDSYYEGHGISLQKMKHPPAGTKGVDEEPSIEPFRRTKDLPLDMKDLMHDDYDVSSAGIDL